jgi:MFS family permease
LISDLTADATRGTGYGLHTFATSLGSAVGPVVGGWLYEQLQGNLSRKDFVPIRRSLGNVPW